MKRDKMRRYSIILILLFVLLNITACYKHPRCEKADIFGHCKKWQGQEPTCKRPVLGLCTDKKDKK